MFTCEFLLLSLFFQYVDYINWNYLDFQIFHKLFPNFFQLLRQFRDSNTMVKRRFMNCLQLNESQARPIL